MFGAIIRAGRKEAQLFLNPSRFSGIYSGDA